MGPLAAPSECYNFGGFAEYSHVSRKTFGMELSVKRRAT
jgi:hypothetical protein